MLHTNNNRVDAAFGLFVGDEVLVGDPLAAPATPYAYADETDAEPDAEQFGYLPDVFIRKPGVSDDQHTANLWAYWDWQAERQRQTPDTSAAVADRLEWLRTNAEAKRLFDAERQHASRASVADKLLSRSALRNLPKPEPLIVDTLDRGTVAKLYGPSNIGKSFVALDWLACIATGKPWQSRPAEKLKVLYIAAEGAHGVNARLSAWESGYGHAVDGGAIADDALTVLPEPVNLLDINAVAELVELVKAERFDVVAIDTLARSIVGGDENSAQDMGQAVAAAYQILAATPGGRGCVLLVHHTGEDRKTSRGSTALEGNVDTVYQMTGDGGQAFKLERTKRRDGPKDDTLALKLAPIAIEGHPDGSCVVEAVNGEPVDPDRSDRVLALFRSHFGETSATRPQLAAVATEVLGMSQATAYRAINDLLATGKLLNNGTARSTSLVLPSVKTTVKTT